MDEVCAASRATVVALLFGGEVDRRLDRMLVGCKRAALLVGKVRREVVPLRASWEKSWDT